MRLASLTPTRNAQLERSMKPRVVCFLIGEEYSDAWVAGLKEHGFRLEKPDIPEDRFGDPVEFERSWIAVQDEMVCEVLAYHVIPGDFYFVSTQCY